MSRQPTIFDIPVAIIVWTMDGCPACENYLPKLVRVAERYSSVLPTIIADVDDFPGAADAFRVQGTPYTAISRYGRPPSFYGYIDGDADESRIEALYYAAASQAPGQVG